VAIVVRDPKLIVPEDSKEQPSDQHEKYEKRSPDKLRQDVYDLTKRVQASEREKDRIDKRAKDQNNRMFRHMLYVGILVGIDVIAFLVWILK
jgi:hypothetical protein